MDECLRLFAYSRSPERQRLVLQFLAAPIDELGDRRREPRAEHREVVLIAEIVGQVMELVGELADRARASGVRICS